MNDRLTRKQRRQLAIGILGLIVALLLVLIIAPVWSANVYYDSQIDHLQMRLHSLRSKAIVDATLRPRYEQLLRSHDSSGHHLKGDTEAVAAAELQRIAQKITSSNAAQILTTQILPAAEEQGFIRVTLRVQVRGPLEGIVQSIYDIEANPTFLFIDGLSLRDGARRRLRGTAEINQFDGEFDLIAYMPRPM